MGYRRTRQEKLIARLRKNQIKPVTEAPVKQTITSEKIAHATANYYVPHIDLPIKSIRADLTKTGIVTILALLLQLALATYLNHGGWQIIKQIFRI